MELVQQMGIHMFRRFLKWDSWVWQYVPTKSNLQTSTIRRDIEAKLFLCLIKHDTIKMKKGMLV
jgi:hypothetical protein